VSAERTNDIEHRFRHHAPDEATARKHEAVRAAYRTLAHFVAGQVPDGRHQALALTALQESMMWANAGIACDSPATEPSAEPPSAAPEIPPVGTAP
jgi:hypothetical protein